MQPNGTKTTGEPGEDIIAALEMIPGVGSLRSLNSMGSSQPSYTLDQRFRREESSHSISSGLSLGIVNIIADNFGLNFKICLSFTEL